MIKYTIKKGDTLSQIAKDHNVPMNVLANLNDIEDVDLIYAGDTLVIPRKYGDRDKLLQYVCKSTDEDEELKKKVLAHAAEMELVIEDIRKEYPKDTYYKTNNVEYLYPTVRRIASLALDRFDKEENTNGFIIIETFRTQDRQGRLYQQGRTQLGKILTNAKAGQSMHNYGLALDVVPTDEMDRPLWNGDESEWDILIKCFKDTGFTCGADWGDKPHFSYNILYNATGDEKYITGTGEGWRYFVG